MNPDITGRPDRILWKHNGNKVVEFNGNEESVYNQYENRITLDWHSAELLITDLRFEDSGDYELEVFMNRNLRQYNYKLEVIGKFFFSYFFSFYVLIRQQKSFLNIRSNATPQRCRNTLQDAQW